MIWVGVCGGVRCRSMAPGAQRLHLPGSIASLGEFLVVPNPSHVTLYQTRQPEEQSSFSLVEGSTTSLPGVGTYSSAAWVGDTTWQWQLIVRAAGGGAFGHTQASRQRQAHHCSGLPQSPPLLFPRPAHRKVRLVKLSASPHGIPNRGRAGLCQNSRTGMPEGHETPHQQPRPVCHPPRSSTLCTPPIASPNLTPSLRQHTSATPPRPPSSVPGNLASSKAF